ncbi:MAG: hypothetical protein ABSG53_32600 [Thermoguttaceae bacterium]|jgi:hypothetical protein
MRWKYQLSLRQPIEIILRKGSIMKTSWTILTIAVALAGSLLAVAAQAGGVARNQYSEGSRGSTHAATAPNSQQGKPKSSTAKPAGPNLGNQDPADGKAQGSPSDNSNKSGQGNKLDTAGETSVACKPNPSKGPAPDLNTNCGRLDCGRGLKIECCPGTVCWGRGNFRCGNSGCGWGECSNRGCCVGCWPDCICCPPPYCTECDNVCGTCYSFDEPSCCSVTPDVAPIPDPTVKIVRIDNPAETQTTFAFTINGQAYSLEAGKTQELELTGNMVIKFDRKP